MIIKPGDKVLGKASSRQMTFLQYAASAIILLIASNSQVFGQLFVVIFGIVAVWRCLGSRPVFMLALFLLIAIPLFQMLQQPLIAENLAVYVYELLVIGTSITLFEAKNADNSVDKTP